MVEALRVKLLSPKTSLPQKYRVLFSLRNIAGEAARQALAEGETTAGPRRYYVLLPMHHPSLVCCCG